MNIEENDSLNFVLFISVFVLGIVLPIILSIYFITSSVTSEKALVKSVYNIENLLLSDSSQSNDTKIVFYEHIIRPITQKDFDNSIIEFKDKIKGSKKEKEILDEIYSLINNVEYCIKSDSFNTVRNILNKEYLKRKK